MGLKCKFDLAQRHRCDSLVCIAYLKIFRLFVVVFNIFISRFFETNCQFQCLKVEKEYKDRRESADKVNLSEAIYIHKGYKTKYVCTKRKHMF